MNLKLLLKEKLTYLQLRKLRNLYYYLTFISHRNNLTKLASIFGSDKGAHHKYTRVYMTHFRKYRFRKINLLEIGAGGYSNPELGGGSLRMWKRYFPLGRIYSIDIYDKSLLEEKRIKIFKGSQIDNQFLEKILEIISKPDIIIDDGSHINSHVIKTFNILFPELNYGGVYVIEDTQTSYWPEFGGDSENLENSETIMNYFKKMTDSLNYKEIIRNDDNPSYFDKNIESIHFYNNLIFIYKKYEEH